MECKMCHHEINRYGFCDECDHSCWRDNSPDWNAFKNEGKTV